MATAKRGFGFWFGFLMNCVYTIAPVLFGYAIFTGNTWTKVQGEHIPPSPSGNVSLVLFVLGLEIALFFHWRKWWQENAH